MKFDDNVFVIIAEKIHSVTIHRIISYKGIVTGYEVIFRPGDQLKIKKGDIFTDKTDATKALFMQKLKSAETILETPAEDKKGDRHWITGHKKHGNRR